MAIYAFMKMESKRSMESTSNKFNKIWNFSITIPMCHTLFLPTEIFILCEQQNTSQRALYVYIDMISLSHGHMMGIVVVVVSQSPQNKCWWVYTVCFLVWVDSIHSQNLLSRRIVYIPVRYAIRTDLVDDTDDFRRLCRRGLIGGSWCWRFWWRIWSYICDPRGTTPPSPVFSLNK